MFQLKKQKHRAAIIDIFAFKKRKSRNVLSVADENADTVFSNPMTGDNPDTPDVATTVTS